ncbi:MAG: serine/threonine protein phosphatase [Lachnospiraceae bacterium]|nr:serine/threonine protein phosphatase [Lachnospiraceae bacterium]
MNRTHNLWKNIFERYHHALPLIGYGILYWVWFCHLEQTVTTTYQVIHMRLDDYIPFCEFFVIPYFLWFAYVSAAVLYLFFTDKQEYYRTCIFLFTGMTIFLIVSTLWPNGHHLRLAAMPRDNVFTRMVAGLWRTDTPTNLWPSIHVYNSLGAHLAVLHSRLRQNRAVTFASFLLCVSIILSTVFIKQHSVFDVFTAFLMAAVLYVTVYRLDPVTAVRTAKAKHKTHPSIS